MGKSLSRAYSRDVSVRKALRKKRISDELFELGGNGYYSNLHQYSKNKIHCSCGLCSRNSKTNNKGNRRKIRGNYAPSYNPPIKDRKRLLSMDNDEQENGII